MSLAVAAIVWASKLRVASQCRCVILASFGRAWELASSVAVIVRMDWIRLGNGFRGFRGVLCCKVQMVCIMNLGFEF